MVALTGFTVLGALDVHCPRRHGSDTNAAGRTCVRTCVDGWVRVRVHACVRALACTNNGYKECALACCVSLSKYSAPCGSLSPDRKGVSLRRYNFAAAAVVGGVVT